MCTRVDKLSSRLSLGSCVYRVKFALKSCDRNFVLDSFQSARQFSVACPPEGDTRLKRTSEEGNLRKASTLSVLIRDSMLERIFALLVACCLAMKLRLYKSSSNVSRLPGIQFTLTRETIFVGRFTNTLTRPRATRRDSRLKCV